MKIPLTNHFTTFRLIPKDLEHLSADSLGQYYESLSQGLLNMKENSFLRLYYKEGKIYVNTDHADFSLWGTQRRPCPSLLKELLGEDVTASNVLNRGDHLKVGGKYLRFFRLKDFPQEIAEHGHFNQTSDYLISMRKLSPSEACSLLDRKRKVFRSDNAGEFSNYKSEEGETQAESLYAQIQLNREGLFEVEFWFWVLSDTEAELSEETQNLLAFFKHRDGSIKIEDLGLSEAFLNYLPGMSPSFKAPLLVPSHYLLGLMPLSGDFLHESGILFHSLNDKSVFLDNFSGANFNMAIVGHSGSGKTFLAQKIIDHHLEKGIKAVILDRGDSFDRLAKYHGGAMFSGKINPLQFKNASFLTDFFSSFIPKEEFSHQQKCLLFKTIRDNLDKIDGPCSLFSLVDEQVENFSLYFEEHRELFTDKALEMSHITYVDTRQYPDSFLAPLFIYLAEYVKNLKGQKIFVFEECWHTLQKNIGHLGEFFRTSRAQGISCVAITQCLDDLLESELGKIIAENSYFKIFFSAAQRENESLDEHDLKRIADLKSLKGQYSEFYLKTPLHRKSLRFYPTPVEYERFTSHFEDRKKIDQFILEFENHFDYKTLIHRWTELKYGTENNHSVLSG